MKSADSKESLCIFLHTVYPYPFYWVIFFVVFKTDTFTLSWKYYPSSIIIFPTYFSTLVEQYLISKIQYLNFSSIKVRRKMNTSVLFLLLAATKIVAFCLQRMQLFSTHYLRNSTRMSLLSPHD